MVYTYSTIRPLLTTGSVILWKGNGVIPWLIRRWSEYSHASLVIRLNNHDELKDRVWLVEALEGGLELRLLSERMYGYNGRTFAMVNDLDTHQQAIVREFAMEQCGKGVRYDYRGLFRNIFGRVSQDADKFFCSEFVCAALRLAQGCSRPNAPRPGDLPRCCKRNVVEVVA